jgi:hypothetical protein
MEKKTDTVKILRDIRDKISKETENMDFREFRKYMETERLESRDSEGERR